MPTLAVPPPCHQGKASEPSILPLHPHIQLLSTHTRPPLPPQYFHSTCPSESCSLTGHLNSMTPCPGPPSHSCSQFMPFPVVCGVLPHSLSVGSIASPDLGTHDSLTHSTAQKVEVRERTTSPVSMEAASRMQGEPPDLGYSYRSATALSSIVSNA